ncbi:NDP-hexose 2,3-dehydratase family protein [Amycolatopsis alba]|uniref:NDP-hexose 2,3-dehydratase n=1 Tax=Amycolatopsis alba DSM 44262 TaxID=1125972 RepID=A0A229REV8_AMYAL|nr:NDP-hexose 2,3-dehydratase family protein [Amycolatopsis alba]OXM45203.1 NDP-hexose 2,3-dehydratase [Amycolatopsis alba DSM 44262]
MVDISALAKKSSAGSGGSRPWQLAESVLSGTRDVHRLADFHRWFADLGQRFYTEVDRIPLPGLSGWRLDPGTGNLGHDNGRFFTVEGLEVRVPGGPVERWSQPIINQPEIGILGILVKRFGGVLHFLMQAKVEPGNHNGLQLSPTVQATRSNYTRAHHGKPVPYLDYFLRSARHGVLTDVRQSEQGSWFYRKRNRNVVLEVTEEVEVLDGFCWLTLGQLHSLLTAGDLVNMDSRTVLSCLPFSGAGLLEAFAPAGDDFRASVIRSCSEDEGSRHSTVDILSWITEVRTHSEVHTRLVPLAGLAGWRRTDDAITHENGRFFEVIGVRVRAGGREVGEWTQPMIRAYRTGVVAFLVKRVDGVLHALVHARLEPGYLDVAELAPTVQCVPENYDHLPTAARPRFLDEVLTAPEDRIRFDATLSEEGGRFYHARNRYLVVETDEDRELDHPDFRWLPLHQLVHLLRHSHYVNIQARSLVACLHSLTAPPPAS